MSFMVPNEKINAADAMPQMDNARSSALNEIRNVTDAMLCADNDKTKLSVNPRPMMSSCNVQTDMSMLREQSTNTMIISGRKDVRKSMMLRISQIIWPWKNKKPSNKTDVVGVAVSAPVSHRTSNITLSGNTISDKRTDGMILTPTLRIFSFEEVNTATRNFSEDSVLKEGGFGKLYKGWIHENSSSKKRSGSVVAIKKLNHESTQEFKQWQSEVNFLGRLSHPNLVKLLGYGWEDEVLFLVYECMPCGTLADHLYKLARKSNDFYPLSWRQRLKICIGVGRALDYLHAGHGIIHLNVKASNIVLDEKFGAKLSDFSLAVNGSGSESQSQDSTNLIGTFGCTDPNYLKTRKPTLKSDTYSFGVVLLEVLCGRQAVEPWNDEDKCSLTTWAIDNISSGQVDDIVAPSLRGEISPDSLKTFVKVAETCLHDEPKKRPSTAHVITKLELALQQQEKAESLPPNERTSVREVLSPTDKSQKEKINFMVASEKTNVADIVSPSLGGQMLPQPSVRSFTFSELKAATRNFRSEAVLGVGGFGVVYKGWINVKCSGKDGSETPIAVKKLNSGSTQGFDEWQSEIEFLGRISHPNLVKLLGYCLEDKELILVYEFMPKGSLDNHLFRSRQPLPWDIRLKILIGAARGMAFLHASEGQVIYRDFKPSNILLDESYHAKLSDFGLAKMGPTDGHSHVTTQIMGTYGYAAPEYVATGHLYVKSDVYGFGVVLVEMLTGLRALDTRRPAGQHNLVDWMKPHLSKKKKLQHVIDKHLVGTYPAKSAAQLAQLAFKCLENEPRNRPSMQEVVQTLETIADRPAQRRVHFSH
ncbi:Protein kinase superfamily protein [Perilla frutescens var. hirtella]|uniref:non-specific serine/threonine protein kinase n=1 Tax=Perilla frutescens var. hirtella TaxID=608512 RepID=A0AAD4P3Z2_PERFH|nr:Protein kinase superfamily protein [Perilla frutescens var. hirtella]